MAQLSNIGRSLEGVEHVIHNIENIYVNDYKHEK